MASEQQFQDDLKTAMKARDMDTVYVLRGLLTVIKTLKTENGGVDLGDAEIAGLVRKEINKRKEAIEYAQKLERSEDIESNERENAVLARYMPKQMDEAQLSAAIKAISSEIGSTEIGPMMKALKERHGGEYDGKLASQLVRQLAAG